MPADLWRMTPREFHAVREGVRRRELRQFSATMTAAWYQARFTRAQKMPDLKKMLKSIMGQDEPERVLTPEELLALVKRWNAELGGTFEGPPEDKG